MTRKYSLHKFSAPGFTVDMEISERSSYSEDQHVANLVNILTGFVCGDCHTECYEHHGGKDKFVELSAKEQLQSLLWSACGAEFGLDDPDEGTWEDAQQPVDDK